MPFGQVLSGILSGERNAPAAHARAYSQSLTAALRVSTARVRWLAWIRPQALSYQTAYQWADVPIASRPDLDVAGAGTRVQLQTGLQLVPTEFWRLFPFYRRLEAAAGRGPGGGRGRPAGGAASRHVGRAAARLQPARIGRDLFLAATGLTDVSVTYRGAFSSSAGGLVGDSYSLLSGLTGAAPGPGLPPRAGAVGPARATASTDPTVNLPYNDLLDDRHALDARTTIEPFRLLRIGLTWQTVVRLDARACRTPTHADGGVTALPAERAGTGESTIYAFGGSYASLLDRHRQRLLDDTAGPLTTATYTSEFLLRSGHRQRFPGRVRPRHGRLRAARPLPDPGPGWDISYSGSATCRSSSASRSRSRCATTTPRRAGPTTPRSSRPTTSRARSTSPTGPTHDARSRSSRRSDGTGQGSAEPNVSPSTSATSRSSAPRSACAAASRRT